jgi:regulator of sigma E protease
VKLFGEDLEEVESEEGQSMRTHPRSFLSKSPLQRASILGAGVFMNLLLAVTSYYLLFSITGFKTLNLPVFFNYKFKYGEVTSTKTIVSGFSEESPAEAVGIEVGEAIVKIDEVEVKNIEEIRNAVGDKSGQEVTVLLKDMRRNTEDTYREVKLTATQDEEGNGLLGVLITESANIYYPNKIMAPFAHSANMLSYTAKTFGEFINIAYKTKSIEPVSSGVSGPVGIYNIVNAIVSYGGIDAVLGLIDFVGLLSLSLAFINIMPLPALDGGRLIFVFFEALTGKQVSHKTEAVVHKWGMIFFLGILLLVTIKDIRQFFFF